MKKWIKEAERAGWEVCKGRGGHYKFIPPDPELDIVVTGSTHSDPRGLLNFKSEMRRKGLDLT